MLCHREELLDTERDSKGRGVTGRDPSAKQKEVAEISHAKQSPRWIGPILDPFPKRK